MQEPDTDRSTDGNLVACRFEGAGFLVDLKDDNAVAALVGDEAEYAARIDVEVPRRLYTGSLVLDESQRPFGRVDAIDRDAVVPAVRAVKELSARMYSDLGARA